MFHVIFILFVSSQNTVWYNALRYELATIRADAWHTFAQAPRSRKYDALFRIEVTTARLSNIACSCRCSVSRPVPFRIRRSPRTELLRKRCDGPQYIGLAERDAAEKHLGEAKAGTTGAPVMRLPISSSGGRSAGGCFVTRMGEASPGPGVHYPNTSSISPRGCPVFASPRALDSADWERLHESAGAHGIRSLRVKPKTFQVHRRWPAHTYSRDGLIRANLGQDSPGPGCVNVSDYDPFRQTSYIKTTVCHPPSIRSDPSSDPYKMLRFLEKDAPELKRV